MGEQVSWILWRIMPGDSGWDRLLDMQGKPVHQSVHTSLQKQGCAMRLVCAYKLG